MTGAGASGDGRAAPAPGCRPGVEAEMRTGRLLTRSGRSRLARKVACGVRRLNPALLVAGIVAGPLFAENVIGRCGPPAKPSSGSGGTEAVTRR